MASRDIVKITFKELHEIVQHEKEEKNPREADKRRSKRPSIQIYRPGMSRLTKKGKDISNMDARGNSETEPWDSELEASHDTGGTDDDSLMGSKENSVERDFNGLVTAFQNLNNEPEETENGAVHQSPSEAVAGSPDSRKKSKRPALQIYVPKGKLLEKESRKGEEDGSGSQPEQTAESGDNNTLPKKIQGAPYDESKCQRQLEAKPRMGSVHVTVGNDHSGISRSVRADTPDPEPQDLGEKPITRPKWHTSLPPPLEESEEHRAKHGRGPKGHSQQRGRHLSSQDARYLPAQDARHPPSQDAWHPAPQDVRHLPMQDARHLPTQDVRHLDARHPPSQDSRHLPTQDVRHLSSQDARNFPSQDSRSLASQDVRNLPPQDVRTNDSYGQAPVQGAEKKDRGGRRHRKRTPSGGYTSGGSLPRPSFSSMRRPRAGSVSSVASDASAGSDVSINSDVRLEDDPPVHILHWDEEVEKELAKQVQDEAQRLTDYIDTCMARDPEEKSLRRKHPSAGSNLQRQKKMSASSDGINTGDVRGRKRDRRRRSSKTESRESSVHSNPQEGDTSTAERKRSKRRNRRNRRRHASANSGMRQGLSDRKGSMGEGVELGLKVTLDRNRRQVKVTADRTRRGGSEGMPEMGASPKTSGGGILRVPAKGASEPRELGVWEPEARGAGGAAAGAGAAGGGAGAGHGMPLSGRGPVAHRTLFDPNNPSKPIIIQNSSLKFHDPMEVQSPTDHPAMFPPPFYGDYPSPGAFPYTEMHPVFYPMFPGPRPPPPQFYRVPKDVAERYREEGYGTEGFYPSGYDPEQLQAAMSKSQARVAAEQLLRDTAPLECQLGNLVSRRLQGPESWRQLNALRKEVQNRFEHAVLLDPELTNSSCIEQQLWKSVYYQVIEVFRRQLSEESQAEAKTMLLEILDEGKEFYEKFLEKLQSKFKFKLSDFLDPTTLPPEVSRTVGLALLSGQRSMICLGDIARYREQANETANYGKARSWYMKAQQIAPKNGRPYNQLAILALYTRRKLDAVYFYMRSLAASNPFITARESLMSLFDEARKKAEANEKKRVAEREQERQTKQPPQQQGPRVEIWVSADGTSTQDTIVDNLEEELGKLSGIELNKRFVLSFLNVHGKLFTKIGMEMFPEACSQMLQEFSVLLQHSPAVISSHRLLQLMAINMFAIRHTALKGEGLEGTCRSLLQEHAVQLSLEMVGLVCGRCSQLLKQHMETPAYPASLLEEDLRQLVPGLKVWVDWMMCHGHLWNPTPCIRPPDLSPEVDIWKNFADLCNVLMDIDTSHVNIYSVKKEGCEPVVLSEDTMMAGFVPMLSAPVNISYIHTTTDKEIASDCLRLAKLRLFGEYICGIDPPMLSFDVHTKRYILVASTPKSEEEKEDYLSDSSESEGVIVESEEDADAESGGEDSLRHLRARKIELKRKMAAISREQENVQAILDKQRHRKTELEIHPTFLIPDTNCFIDHHAHLKKLLDSKKFTLVIPLTVINELDGLARSPVEGRYDTAEHAALVQQQAAAAVAMLEQEFQAKNPHIRALTARGTVLDSIAFRSEELGSQGNNDDRILNCCLHYCKDNAKDFLPKEKDKPVHLYREVVLLTEDRNLRLKAHTCNVPVKDVPSFLHWSKIT